MTFVVFQKVLSGDVLKPVAISIAQIVDVTVHMKTGRTLIKTTALESQEFGGGSEVITVDEDFAEVCQKLGVGHGQ